jgi:hypothetical protein
MSEVPLYLTYRILGQDSARPGTSSAPVHTKSSVLWCFVQGYLTYKKTHRPRTLP